jgi:hypothetical protein
MAIQHAFWLDENFDREHAPDGRSRYGAEVRRRAGEFCDAWGDIAPVTFAVTAWRVATALLVSAWPAELSWTKEWWRDRGWRDWPQLFGQYVPPSEQDLTRSPHLRALLLVEAPVRLDDLPAAPDGPDGELEQTARRAVTVLVRELNELLTPIIGQLEAGVPADS